MKVPDISFSNVAVEVENEVANNVRNLNFGDKSRSSFGLIFQLFFGIFVTGIDGRQFHLLCTDLVLRKPDQLVN